MVEHELRLDGGPVVGVPVEGRVAVVDVRGHQPAADRLGEAELPADGPAGAADLVADGPLPLAIRAAMTRRWTS